MGSMEQWWNGANGREWSIGGMIIMGGWNIGRMIIMEEAGTLLE